MLKSVNETKTCPSLCLRELRLVSQRAAELSSPGAELTVRVPVRAHGRGMSQREMPGQLDSVGEGELLLTDALGRQRAWRGF